MRRLGFRRVLPIVLTLTHVCLIVAGGAQHESHQNGPMVVRDGVVQWDPEPPPQPTTRKLTSLLNLPAVAASIPVVALLDHYKGDIPLLFITTLFVPLLWYGIGYWVDGQLGYVHRRLKPDSTVRQLARDLSALGAACFLILSVAVALHGPYRPPGYWGPAIWLFWSAFWFVIAVSCIRRRRTPVP
jgi:hypothetical protein